MKGILEFLAKKNRWAVALLIILVLFGSIYVKVQHNIAINFKNKYNSEVKLRNALTDTITTYKNKEGEWVSEKLTLQASIGELENDKITLTKDQQRLVDRVREANKHNEVITAALIRANFVIDSIMHGGLVLVDTTNKTVEFIESNDSSLRYNFKAFGVLPYPIDTKPSLLIRNLTLPNEQFIKFFWQDNKKEGYPIAFSVSNSNKYVKIYDVNSYAIPTIQKEILDPNGWEKVMQWLNKNGKIVGYVAGGVVVGAGGTYLLMK